MASPGLDFIDETVRPERAGAFSQWSPQGKALNWDCVAGAGSTFEEIVRPSGVGSLSQWTPIGATFNFQCVNEAEPPNPSVNVRTNPGGGGKIDSHASAITLPGGIVRIDQTLWANYGFINPGDLPVLQGRLKVAGTTYTSPDMNLSAAGQKFSWAQTFASPGVVGAVEIGYRNGNGLGRQVVEQTQIVVRHDGGDFVQSDAGVAGRRDSHFCTIRVPGRIMRVIQTLWGRWTTAPVGSTPSIRGVIRLNGVDYFSAPIALESVPTLYTWTWTGPEVGLVGPIELGYEDYDGVGQKIVTGTEAVIRHTVPPAYPIHRAVRM